jgi:DNA-directed RNA polymerase alpha subunit
MLSELLTMSIGDYFTLGRCLAAGVDRRKFTQALNCLKHSGRFDYESSNRRWIPSETVGDIASFSRRQLLQTRNMGKSTRQTIEDVLNRDGITLSE